MGFLSSKRSFSHPPTPNSLLSIKFRDSRWGIGPVFDWYRGLSDSLGETFISRIQVRKDTRGVVPHRFIVLYMQDGSVHRFDRRPDRTVSNVAGLVLILKDKPVATKDECVRNLAGDTRTEMETQTIQEIELILDGKVDLEVVLTACFAISKDPSAQKYTLYAHNCFFFSWTILMFTSRHCLPYEIPSPEVLLQRLRASYLPQFTTFLVDEATDILLDLVGEIVTIFLDNLGPTVYQGLPPFARVAWFLPRSVVRSICQHILRARLHFGLRKHLERQVADVVEKKAVVLCRQGLGHDNLPALLEKHLWLRELDKVVGPVLRVELIRILWGSIFDAISSAYNGGDPLALVQEVKDPSLKFMFLGRRMLQYIAVCNAILHAALHAARQAADREEEKARQDREADISQLSYDALSLTQYGDTVLPVLNERMFDLAWKAAEVGALEAAQTVVRETRARMRYKDKGDKMWEEIWRTWAERWAEAQKITQRKSIETVNRIVQKVLEVGGDVVIAELSDASTHFVQARVRKLIDSDEKGKSRSRKLLQLYSDRKMTNGTLQELMQAIMKKDTINSEQLGNVNETMSRIWTDARKLPALKEKGEFNRGCLNQERMDGGVLCVQPNDSKN
ncbi:hypothetical protein WG66_014682 [Moniliophthora roreri]|nr:hypothetical protein WG66_014682 [Moniliophthora roreri]